MPTFDMVVVGSGGGPDETNLSAYLLKPSDAAWEGGIIALEAGSGQGALSQLLKANPRLFDSHDVRCSEDVSSSIHTSSEIFSFIRCFLITHAHLDHISSLVLSAGSLGGQRKRIYATKQVLHDLEIVFSDRIWPNLATWNEDEDDFKLLYSPLSLDNNYEMVYPGISARTVPLSHGSNEHGSYESSAFFIRHDESGHEFLFFGDVEPDSVADRPQTLQVWKAAAPKIPSKLSTIFIECSWPSGRNDDALYGHLTPEHLVNELTALASEVVKLRMESQSMSRGRPARKRQKRNSLVHQDLKDALDGLRVCIVHCKEVSNGGLSMREVIVHQVKDLVLARQLGADIIAVEQGMRIRI
ncbi:cyclic-AMP phosphodiesterase [Cyathus striatus]|nr:cyclic-AMP phosphodiesterase [Cyathus striatus]